MAKICSMKECHDLHDTKFTDENGKEKVYVYGMRVSNSMKLKGLGRHANFGCPFMTTEVANKLTRKFKRKYKGYGTVDDVTKLYIDWIEGKAFPNIQPKRRQWIHHIIHSPEVLKMEFLYYDNKPVSHITVLEDLIRKISVEEAKKKSEEKDDK